MQTVFTYRSSRSPGLLAGIMLAVAVETIAIHLLLHRTHPVLSWSVVLLSVLSGVWIAADYRARGRGRISLESERLDVRIGLRPACYIPLEAIADVVRAGWRDIPRQNREYINLTAPAQPNVIIKIREPVRVPIGMGLKRSGTLVGLHVDNPEEFESSLRNVKHVSS